MPKQKKKLSRKIPFFKSIFKGYWHTSMFFKTILRPSPFCEFLFAAQDKKTLFKKGATPKGKSFTKFFPTRFGPTEMGDENEMANLLPLKLYPFTIN